MPLPVTALFAGFNILLMCWLAVRVIRIRQTGISLGDGGNPTLQRLIRGHGNAAEYMPLGLIMLGLTEGMGAPGWTVALLGLGFTAGRLAHALHFADILSEGKWRAWGMMATFAALALGAFGLIGHALFMAL
ncbi:MAG: MAPEG family protein [Pseudomonadota bacterium]